MSTTYDKVADIIAETCDIPRESIKPESHATHDLEIDSLDFLDIAFAIDKAFGIKLPLEQWTQEVNDGTASTDKYFVLQNSEHADRRTDRGKRRLRRQRMRLEYFQMIDRIVDVDIDGRRLRSACTVPKESTIFEGHFPTYPLMPGVLLIECMAQTTGWLVCVLGRFAAMPFLAGVKEAKFRNAGVSRRCARIRQAASCTRAPATRSPNAPAGATARKSATPSSLSASCRFRARNSARRSSAGASGSTFRSGVR